LKTEHRPRICKLSLIKFKFLKRNKKTSHREKREKTKQTEGRWVFPVVLELYLLKDYAFSYKCPYIFVKNQLYRPRTAKTTLKKKNKAG
jgi:hypothetical protein